MKLLSLIILGVLVMAAIIFLGGIDKTFNVLLTTDPLYLVPSIFLVFLSIFLYSLRWYVFVKKANIPLSLKDALKISLIGIFFSNITPSARLGGEPVRVYLTNKWGKTPTKKSLATILSERILDGIVFEFIAIFCFFSFFINAPPLLFWVYILCLLLLTVLVFFLIIASTKPSLAKKIGKKIVNLAKRIKRLKIGSEFEQRFFEDIIAYNREVRRCLFSKQAIFSSIFSLLVWISETLRVYLIFLALHYNPPFFLVLSALVVSSLFGGIPFLPGGLAIVESSLIFVYSSAGIPFILAGAITIVDRLISYWIPTFVSGFITYKSIGGLTWKQRKGK